MPARFDVHLAQHGSRAAIGDVVELELQKIRNPVTHAEVHPEITHRSLLILGSSTDNDTDLAAGGKEVRGLSPEDVEIVFFANATHQSSF